MAEMASKGDGKLAPPAILLTDIAFNLLIFFVVCASTEPSDGRKQDIPGSKQSSEAAQQSDNHVEIALTRTTASINGDVVPMKDFRTRLKGLLEGKKRPEDRVVVVKSSRDTSYEHWIKITSWIEEEGGVTTLQMEEEQSVQVQ
jgi:biopolymer transport protein ExbD